MGAVPLDENRGPHCGETERREEEARATEQAPTGKRTPTPSLAFGECVAALARAVRADDWPAHWARLAPIQAQPPHPALCGRVRGSRGQKLGPKKEAFRPFQQGFQPLSMISSLFRAFLNACSPSLYSVSNLMTPCCVRYAWSFITCSS